MIGSSQLDSALLLERAEEITALKTATLLLVEHISSSTELGEPLQAYLGLQKITLQRSKTQHSISYSITVEDEDTGTIPPSSVGEE